MLVREALRHYFFDGAELLLEQTDEDQSCSPYQLVIGFQDLRLLHAGSGELAALEDHTSVTRDELSNFLAQIPSDLSFIDIVYDHTIGIPITVHCSSLVDRKRDEAVSNLIGSETPYGPENTLSFWVDVSAGSIEAIILPRDIVERILQAVHERGLSIGRMGAAPDGLQNISLRPFWWNGQPQAAADESFTDRCRELLFGMAPFYKALGAAFLLALVSVYLNLAYLNFQSASNSIEVQQARRALAARAAQWNDANTFIAQQKVSLAQVALLNSLAEALEDGSWLTRYRSNASAVEVTGLSRSAADALDTIAFIDEVDNVRLLSGVVRDQNAGVERFRIGFDLKVSP